MRLIFASIVVRSWRRDLTCYTISACCFHSWLNQRQKEQNPVSGNASLWIPSSRWLHGVPRLLAQISASIRHHSSRAAFSTSAGDAEYAKSPSTKRSDTTGSVRAARRLKVELERQTRTCSCPPWLPRHPDCDLQFVWSERARGIKHELALDIGSSSVK